MHILLQYLVSTFLYIVNMNTHATMTTYSPHMRCHDKIIFNKKAWNKNERIQHKQSSNILFFPLI